VAGTADGYIVHDDGVLSATDQVPLIDAAQWDYGQVLAAAVSPNDQYFYVLTQPGIVSTFEQAPETYDLIAQIPVDVDPETESVAVALSPDPTRLYVAASREDGTSTIELANALGGSDPVADIPGTVQSLTISPTGDRLYATTTDNQVLAYAISEVAGEPYEELPPLELEQPPTAVAISTDASLLYAGTADAVNLYDLTTDQPRQIGEPIPVDGTVTNIALSPDSNLALVSTDQELTRIGATAIEL
jgi:DNA-binding beta-propeller fold protein YncE